MQKNGLIIVTWPKVAMLINMLYIAWRNTTNENCTCIVQSDIQLCGKPLGLNDYTFTQWTSSIMTLIVFKKKTVLFILVYLKQIIIECYWYKKWVVRIQIWHIHVYHGHVTFALFYPHLSKIMQSTLLIKTKCKK